MKLIAITQIEEDEKGEIKELERIDWDELNLYLVFESLNWVVELGVFSFRKKRMRLKYSLNASLELGRRGTR